MPAPALHRTRRRLLAVAAGAVAVCGLSGCTGIPPHPHPVPTDSPTSIRAASRLTTALLEAIVLPSGAVPQDTAPAAVLRRPTTSVDCPKISEAHRFWTLAGYSIDTAEQFLERHVPTRLVLVGSGTASDPHGKTATEVTFGIPAEVEFATLQVTAVPARGGVALRADATAIPDTSRCSHA